MLPFPALTRPVLQPTAAYAPSAETLEMQQRYERALDGLFAAKARRRAALATSTLTQAVVDVLDAIGLQPLTRTQEYRDDFNQPQRKTLIVTPIHDDVIGACVVTSGAERSWERAGLRGNKRSGDQRLMDMGDQRLMDVYASINTVLLGGITMCEMLSGEPDASDDAWGLRSLTLTMWWQARLAEGQTPESARFLLELTVHPNLLRRLTYTDDDTPAVTLPVLDSTDATVVGSLS